MLAVDLTLSCAEDGSAVELSERLSMPSRPVVEPELVVVGTPPDSVVHSSCCGTADTHHGMQIFVIIITTTLVALLLSKPTHERAHKNNVTANNDIPYDTPFFLPFHRFSILQIISVYSSLINLQSKKEQMR